MVFRPNRLESYHSVLPSAQHQAGYCRQPIQRDKPESGFPDSGCIGLWIPVASAYAKYTRSNAPREMLPLPSSASM